MNCPVVVTATVSWVNPTRITPFLFDTPCPNIAAAETLVFKAIPGNYANNTLRLSLKNVDTIAHIVTFEISPAGAFLVGVPPAFLPPPGTDFIPGSPDQKYSNTISPGETVTFSVGFRSLTEGSPAIGSIIVTVTDSGVAKPVETITILVQGYCDASFQGGDAGTSSPPPSIFGTQPAGALNSFLNSAGVAVDPSAPVRNPQGSSQKGTPVSSNNGPQSAQRRSR